MADILRFPTPLPPLPAPADEVARTYADLIDAYNENAEAQRALAGTTTRLQWALKRFEEAQHAASQLPQARNAPHTL